MLCAKVSFKIVFFYLHFIIIYHLYLFKFMKSLFVALLCLLGSFVATAQNIFPTTGKVGIGTNSPNGILHVVDNSKHYYVNRTIPGATNDTLVFYLLLHRIYVTGAENLPDSYVMGKFSAVRGGTQAYNRKWTVEVNTASAYQSNMGNIISYGDNPALVALTYNSVQYLAVSVPLSALVYSFSFTGWAQNEAFQLVPSTNVSQVKIFNSPTEVSIQAPLKLKNIGSHIQFSPTASDPAYSNWIKMNHEAFPGSELRIGIANNTYEVVQQRNSSVLESYRDLHISAANSGKIVFENGRLGTTITPSMVIANNKNVGIGVENPTYKLAVDGTIGARRVKVTQEQWADYVFHPDYKLPSLTTVEQFINDNKHLPDIPSEKEVKEKGIDLGEINKLYLQKIEELTLYIIDLQKQVNVLKENAAKQAK